jgi:anaerobic magnesium-protoporphyrin IX monomethyl ester cyclase
MKVLFLEVDTERSWAVASIGPAFLAGALTRAGHESSFFRVTVDHDAADVLEIIADEAPGLLGISMTTRQWLRSRALVGELRRTIDLPVIAGGLHATFAPQAVLASPGFDFVCLGEGEQALLDLVTALDAGRDGHGIDNIWARGGAEPALRPPLSPIDSLPFMARDHLDEHHGIVHMATQRGCPFPCTYCAARMYDQLYEKNGESYGRRRSVPNVLAELEAIASRQRISYVIFLDDTFTLHHPWVREFCVEYRQSIGAPFCLHARVETVNERLLGELADAGCKQITYGVESGSPRFRRDVMKRFASNDRFKEVFEWTRAAGITVTANYMLGLPGETREDLQMTLDLATELCAYDFGYFVFYPYPGTQLFQVCKDNGYLPDDWLARPANHRSSILTLPTLTQADIAEYYDRFTDLRASIHADRGGAAATEHVHQSADCG